MSTAAVGGGVERLSDHLLRYRRVYAAGARALVHRRTLADLFGLPEPRGRGVQPVARRHRAMPDHRLRHDGIRTRNPAEPVAVEPARHWRGAVHSNGFAMVCGADRAGLLRRHRAADAVSAGVP